MGTLTSNTGMAFSKWYDSVHGEPSYQETFEAGAAWQAAQAAQPAQNEWKEAVIEQLAAHSMDAPVSDSPTVILAKIIHMAVLQATDPAIKVAQVPIYQYQLANGNWIDQTKESYDYWIDQTNESHDYNVRHGQATVRILYAAPSTKEGQQ